MEATTQVRMTDEIGVRFGLTVGAQVAILLAFGTTGPYAALAVVAGTALVGHRLPAPVLLGCGLTGWALWTGFVENSYGELTFADPDLVRLGLIVLGTWLAAHW